MGEKKKSHVIEKVEKKDMTGKGDEGQARYEKLQTSSGPVDLADPYHG